jgi:hypothetical protein
LLEMKDRVKQVFSPAARIAAAPVSGARTVEALPDAGKDSEPRGTSS